MTDAKRVAREALGGVDVFHASEAGPDGPWHVGRVTVRRTGDVIHVRGFEGMCGERVPVADLPDGEPAVRALADRIADVNRRVGESL